MPPCLPSCPGACFPCRLQHMPAQGLPSRKPCCTAPWDSYPASCSCSPSPLPQTAGSAAGTSINDWILLKAKERFKSLEKLFATGQRDRDIYGTVTEDGILHLGELIYRKGECAESYLARRGLLDDWRYPVCFYGYLDESGCRTEDASIPGSPRDRAESQKKWQDTLQDYIGSLSDDDVLVGIDCHR